MVTIIIFCNYFLPFRKWICNDFARKDGDFDFDSNNPEYIMRRIREEKLHDSTVTIVLIGNCTHSRRYVDWEIKASGVFLYLIKKKMRKQPLN